MEDEGLLVNALFEVLLVVFYVGSAWSLVFNNKSNCCTIYLQTLFILSVSPFKFYERTHMSMDALSHDKMAYVGNERFKVGFYHMFHVHPLSTAQFEILFLLSALSQPIDHFIHGRCSEIVSSRRLKHYFCLSV